VAENVPSASGLKNWLNARTGCCSALRWWRNRPVPGGPAWWKVTGALLLWLVVLEFVSGILLMLVYTPSATDAWASLVYLEERIAAGAVVRAIHFWAAQALLVVAGLHLVRLLITRAYRAPRELLWISGLLLAGLLVAFCVTGNPLPWSQKAYGQIEVEMHIIGSIPLVGPVAQRLLMGGTELGQRTLNHLYTLHVAVLPLLLVLFVGFHLSQLVRLGRSNGSADSEELPYFPHQSIRNAVAVAVVVGAVLVLSYRYRAPLGPPADPVLPSSPRPEWYFLALFELRRYFTGNLEFVATALIPGLIGLWLVLLPWIDRGGRAGKLISYATAVVLVLAHAVLTVLPVVRDARDEQHQAVVAELRKIGSRAIELAAQGVPPAGPGELLHRDPVTMGPILFRQHCTSCHSYGGEWAEEPKASDLKGFGSEEWIWGLVQNPADPRFFGRTKHKQMIQWSKETFATASDDEKAEIRQAVRWLATHPRGVPPEDDEQSEFAQGYMAFDGWCIECHTYEGDGGFNLKAPDFTGYGSEEWIARMIQNPADDALYGDSAEMPAFADKLTPLQIRVLARWLAGGTDPVEP